MSKVAHLTTLFPSTQATGGLDSPAPRKADDRRLLRRYIRGAAIAWSLAIGMMVFFSLGPGQSHGLSAPTEVWRGFAVSHLLVWLLGLAGIAVAADYAFRHLNRRLAELGKLELTAKVFDDSLQAIAITDPYGKIIKVNPMFSEITGFEPAEVIGKDIAWLDEPDSDGAEGIADPSYKLRSASCWAGETRKRRKNGEAFTAWENASAIDDDAGQRQSCIFMFQDITDRKSFSSRLEQLAHYDPLTDLPNRRLLSDRVAHAVQRASRSNEQHALLFIDLDHFKRINDTMGHLSGDHLLVVVAERLQNCVRASDTVARLGGDEFAILLEEIEVVDVERIVEKILTTLTVPILLEGRNWHIGASIGISLSPRDGADMAALLKNADTALYRAKADGRHCFRFFDQAMADQAALQVGQEAALRLAVESKAFVLHYQPQLDMANGKIIGVEALVRWQRGDEIISPQEFIALAEDTGLIVPIGRWLLGAACRDIKSLHGEGFGDLKLAINLSAVELKQTDFVEQILLTLAESGFPPNRLELEITESTMLVDVNRVISVLDALAATGISLSIDDFGTGYSSLSYLKQLPVDFIKIDRSFVRNTPDDKEDCTIVQAIVTMSHTLDMKVVAEGVETDQQMQFLSAKGCDISQGYLISKPLPIDELRPWLGDWQAQARRRVFRPA
ncbi:MAG: diguanylate cyclase [Hydrogenophilales bacterium CG03_land_8_20_14_0_80_62_28]|nr:EAL domain-containing protein [Betaproteobacteria bacterium]OIO76664.1 MAG: hypothetical protein AUJ86_11230 [Hydrogenophilaceae bacterium CG1_02_62_390]PIV23616.1 MAG: diguanylate cyclase [Hydrogenophilales bacterium CG03_land_8_20_14_0_80_62_28]PIW39409.1 MAG: diguanylate cyclase [Hydrogenophilales bacterium CG15_BIG_FIL_POST_REV_8_21_14_020_62_31]PIW72381.1 MAG: diguanylate cyclase [Hydrogenophilales bacterium CG12_big_fil_rev_8_21_14_0_65_61_21]PIX01581.1 MAG: diguanylate cyclase [Hydro